MLLKVSQSSQTAPPTGDSVQIQGPLRVISHSDHHSVVKEGVSKEEMLTVILCQQENDNSWGLVQGFHLHRFLGAVSLANEIR